MVSRLYVDELRLYYPQIDTYTYVYLRCTHVTKYNAFPESFLCIFNRYLLV